jgi:hypothetical protein
VTAKKEKRTEPLCDCKIFGVPDCNQYLCVVAKRKPDFVCVVEKLLGYLEYDCKPG